MRHVLGPEARPKSPPASTATMHHCKPWRAVESGRYNTCGKVGRTVKWSSFATECLSHPSCAYRLKAHAMNTCRMGTRGVESTVEISASNAHNHPPFTPAATPPPLNDATVKGLRSDCEISSDSRYVATLPDFASLRAEVANRKFHASNSAVSDDPDVRKLTIACQALIYAVKVKLRGDIMERVVVFESVKHHPHAELCRKPTTMREGSGEETVRSVEVCSR